jgi:hypothetical protein
MNRLLVLTVSISLAGWATIVGGQQPGGGAPAPTGVEGLAMDCPPAKVRDAVPAPAEAMGTPSGTGTGSGIAARPSEGPPQRVEGAITQLESTRTERGIHVGELTLWVQPSTAILVGCEKAAITDLKQGMRVKAAYDVKDGRNVAWVIEAQTP